jgi:hypothetical protein
MLGIKYACSIKNLMMIKINKNRRNKLIVIKKKNLKRKKITGNKIEK